MMKTYKVKGESRQSQASFMLYYDITLMQHVSAENKKPSSGENRVSNKSYHADYLNSLIVSVYTAGIRTFIWLLLETDVNTESSSKICVWELGSVLIMWRGKIHSVLYYSSFSV